MPSLLSFAGRMGRAPYLGWSLAAFFSQHLVVWVAVAGADRAGVGMGPLVRLAAAGEALASEWWFYVAPMRSLVTQPWSPSFLEISMGPSLETYLLSNAIMMLAMTGLLLVAWVLAGLAFRRAADAGVSPWAAAMVVAPILQIPAILYLGAVPTRAAPAPAADPARARRSGLTAAVQGLLVGMASILAVVGVGSLVFGTYGYGMFVVAPLVVGAVVAYFGNRFETLGAGHTSRLVMSALALGGLGLVVFALEGMVCIVMSAPLWIAMGLIGGLLGRAVASASPWRGGHALASFAIVPMVFAVETALPVTTGFETRQSVEVDAPPELVWQAIVRMDRIEAPPALPFRLGIAFPVSGEVLGEGVGARRRGTFSTGTAIERVTEWTPHRKLAFVVEEDVPSMREWSPYEDIRTPHLTGYFRTTHTSFELVPLPDGRTTVVERTAHELRLEPVLYWLPFARWAVAENNARVLTHIRQQAERSAAGRH